MKNIKHVTAYPQSHPTWGPTKSDAWPYNVDILEHHLTSRRIYEVSDSVNPMEFFSIMARLLQPTS